MRRRLAFAVILAAGVAVVSSRDVAAQIPERFENLQVLPAGIARDSLVLIMRGFSFALGVRCQYCHSGGDGVSFAGVTFASDDKQAKRTARFMLRMVARQSPANTWPGAKSCGEAGGTGIRRV